MIIGIGGEKESGKDTVADMLVKEHSYRRLAFADNLKNMCIKVFELTWAQCYDVKLKEEKFLNPVVLDVHTMGAIWNWAVNKNHMKSPENALLKMEKFHGKELWTPREVLQFIGTEVLRDIFHEDYHVEVVFREIDRRNLKDVVIPDARFANERKRIKGRDGINVLIDCPQTKDSGDKHKSENDLGEADDYDFVIINDKDKGLEVLRESVSFFFKELTIKTDPRLDLMR